MENISFSLLPHEAETHNRGKCPVKVLFMLGSIEIFSVFFKPRDARIDKIVIELFRSLNQLPAEKKSSESELPCYTIENVTNGGQRASFWEFIDGNRLHGDEAGTAIKKERGFTKEQRDALRKQLLRLESICRFLHISDLHLENLIFVPEQGGNIRVVPIDLESIQRGNATGLFAVDPDLAELTEAEMGLLKSAEAEIGEVPSRFVPIPTSHFTGGMTRCDAFTDMASAVIKKKKKKGYTCTESKERIEWLILEDFINNDVPYLLEYQSQIYYGELEQGNVIAARRH